MTAMNVASIMELPEYARDAMQYDLHPQQRTLAFHRFYGAPIGPAQPDRGFSHMPNQRVAFRAAFIVSEVIEMLEKGLGLSVSLNVHQTSGGTYSAHDEKDICSQFEAALAFNYAKRDIVEVVDALGDLNVVVNGFAIELGVDMRAVDQEICASNFTKAGENGEPLLGDGITKPLGKVLKGPNFVKPNIASILRLEDSDAVQK